MYTLPPTYLSDYAVPSRNVGPAGLLFDGSWCGHGEPLFGVFDVLTPESNAFQVCLPSRPSYPELVAVMAKSPSGKSFMHYDPRKHPASIYAMAEKEFPYNPARPFACPSCKGDSFEVAVGFEVPGDSNDRDDTSWFALAVECVDCRWKSIIFEDETA